MEYQNPFLRRKLLSLYVYYSSYWDPSKTSYHKLEIILCDLSWDNNSQMKVFHKFSWDICCLPEHSSDMGLFYFQHQGLALCTKWII